MKRIRLKIAYDGTDFLGFQKLPEKRTVEGTLNEALCGLCGEDISIIGASRTDSGVHALGNVAVFDTESSIPEERFAYAINQRLPKDLRIVESEACDKLWHPRREKGIKTYEYRIYNGRIEDPLRYRFFHFCPYSLDIDAMREALSYIRGEHDFTSFANPASQILLRGESAVRTIYEAELIENGGRVFDGGRGELILRLRGDGFLYHMVRIIAGTVLSAGTGAIKPSAMEDILEKRDRTAAGMTAPAKGLCLMSIDYER